MAHDWKADLVTYLQDAHAMEEKSLQTLQAAVAVAGDPQLESLYQGHVAETQRHLELLKERLEAHGTSRSLLKDLGGRLAAVGVGAGRVAQQAGDHDAVEMADKILVNERQAAEKLAASYDLALERAVHGSVRA